MARAGRRRLRRRCGPSGTSPVGWMWSTSSISMVRAGSWTPGICRALPRPTTSIPAMTAATISGSGEASAQPAAAAKAATARNASRTARTSPGRRRCRRPRVGPASGAAARHRPRPPADQDRPDDRRRVTIASSAPGWEPASVAPMTASAPRPRARTARPASADDASRPELHLVDRAVQDPPGPDAAGPGRRIRLVVAERHEQVQRVGVEREPDVRRRRHGRRVGVRVDDRPR